MTLAESNKMKFREDCFKKKKKKKVHIGLENKGRHVLEVTHL